MRNLMRIIAATGAALTLLLAAGAANAATTTPQAAHGLLPLPAFPDHIVLKAGGGHLALDTTGVTGSAVTVAPFHPRNRGEDWRTNHEPGAAFPGGRFGIFWAPGGMQTSKYVHASVPKTYLVNGAPAATIFTAFPVRGGYTALTYLKGGSELSTFELTYLGHGQVALRPEGAHGPTASQLWKITG